MQQRGVLATWVRGVIEALAGSGLDVDAVCREAGLDRQAMEASDAGCPTEQLSALWEVAARRSGNSAIGLMAQRNAHPASFDGSATP